MAPFWKITRPSPTTASPRNPRSTRRLPEHIPTSVSDRDGQYSSPTGLNIYGALLENYAAFSDNGQPPQSALNQAIAGTYPNFGFRSGRPIFQPDGPEYLWRPFGKLRGLLRQRPAPAIRAQPGDCRNISQLRFQIGTANIPARRA